MKNWLAKMFSFIFSLLAAVIGYMYSHPLTFHLCANTYQFNSYTGCSDNVIGAVGMPLFLFGQWALFVATIVLFIPWSVFKSWLKFAAWFLPLCFIFIAVTPVSYTGFGPDFFPYYRINAAHDAGIAFTVLSLLLIAWKMYRQRRTV